MDVTAWIMVGIAIVGCLTTSAILIVRVTRTVSSIEGNISTQITNTMALLRKEFKEENDVLRHEFGEALTPIRTHIALYEEKHYKLELYIRDNYIEVDTFRNALTDIKTLINEVKDKVDKISEDSINWRRGKSQN